MSVGVTCGWCGSWNEAGRGFCEYCGSDLTYDYAPGAFDRPWQTVFRIVLWAILVATSIVIALAAAAVLMP